jgi:hypothetical protein
MDRSADARWVGRVDTTFMQRAYQEIINFIAAGPNPQRLTTFQSSAEGQARVAQLIHQEKNGGLTQEEKEELDHYLQIEHLMRMVKAQAYHHLAHE